MIDGHHENIVLPFIRHKLIIQINRLGLCRHADNAYGRGDGLTVTQNDERSDDKHVLRGKVKNKSSEEQIDQKKEGGL